MKRFNLYDTYLFGKRLGPLFELTEESTFGPNLFHLWFARQALQAHVHEDSPLLEAARRATNQVIVAINAIMPDDIEKVFEIEADKKIGVGSYRIKKSLEELESVLANDMPGVPAYIVSQKGIYRTEDLIIQADHYFPLPFRKDIPQQTKLDICEAGKCLAFELPTACSFHLWRAVESMIGAYYEAITGKTFDQDGVQRNWGAKIKALNGATADSRITDFLDHIREQYRNPQTHPEETVDVNEALTLFGAAASSINQQVTAIQSLKKQKPLALLAPVVAPATGQPL